MLLVNVCPLLGSQGWHACAHCRERDQKSAWGLRSWPAFQVSTPQVQEQVSRKSLHKMRLPWHDSYLWTTGMQTSDSFQTLQMIDAFTKSVRASKGLEGSLKCPPKEAPRADKIVWGKAQRRILMHLILLCSLISALSKKCLSVVRVCIEQLQAHCPILN